MRQLYKILFIFFIAATVSFAAPADSTVADVKADSVSTQKKAEVVKNTNVREKKTPTSWTKLKDMFM